MKEIQLREAKANLSAVIDDAMDGKASVITRRGRPEAVVISYEEWRRLSAVPSFAKLLMSAPLAGVELPERDESATLRDPEV
ncbi:MAG TPA: type II toxin-antitoxin system prevent-host-death family antitoxin [Hyphomonadaceae bacterium]|jgi:prevent-host-death family protein|nr:type II toxin-antitoxin system prevent-host-death family antitoxin [Hyphomonadaceae bacterium]